MEEKRHGMLGYMAFPQCLGRLQVDRELRGMSGLEVELGDPRRCRGRQNRHCSGLEALNKMRWKAEKDSWEIREHLWVIVTTESHIS